MLILMEKTQNEELGKHVWDMKGWEAEVTDSPTNRVRVAREATCKSPASPFLGLCWALYFLH